MQDIAFSQVIVCQKLDLLSRGLLGGPGDEGTCPAFLAGVKRRFILRLQGLPTLGRSVVGIYPYGFYCVVDNFEGPR